MCALSGTPRGVTPADGTSGSATGATGPSLSGSSTSTLAPSSPSAGCCSSRVSQ
ncbi:hypothetical protein [Aquabacterium sp. J223]|uniref:hypothetical protein n=1 Tax=Aquabacterium sp. J223 TaxID=2898431 RepID=UPI0021AE0C2C|nr:hypothetical protein [Aquabacterium sp. J223]UUX94824.1 hypothetical protein LRS07_16290 [Aquabacterium sp. J223]